MISTNRNLWIVVSVALAAIIAGMLFIRSEAPSGSPGGQPAESSPAMPTGHSPVTRPPDAALPATSGSVAAVDPDAHFTHFRVGQRNVKTLLPDGDII